MTAKTEPEWMAFQRRVARVYRALGCDVIHDVDVGGRQIDVLVQERTGTGRRVLTAVECKAYKNRIGPGVIEDLVQEAQRLINKHVDHYVVVSLVGFTQKGREVADHAGIIAVEIEDLESQLPAAWAEAYSVRSDAGAAPLAEDLRSQLRVIADMAESAAEEYETELSTQEAATIDFSGFQNSFLKVVLELRSLSDMWIRAETSSIAGPRVAGALAGLEDATARCIDSAAYLRQVSDLIVDADVIRTPTAGSEADHTSANLIRLRELANARAQLRLQLRRFRDGCVRLRALGI